MHTETLFHHYRLLCMPSDGCRDVMTLARVPSFSLQAVVHNTTCFTDCGHITAQMYFLLSGGWRKLKWSVFVHYSVLLCNAAHVHHLFYVVLLVVLPLHQLSNTLNYQQLCLCDMILMQFISLLLRVAFSHHICWWTMCTSK